MEQQGGVGHSAGHRAGLGKVIGGGAPVAAVAGNAALGRFNAEYAAEAGGDTDGAAAVAAGGDGAESGGERGPGAAAGAAGGAGSVPGITARRAKLVFGSARLAEFGGIGFAEDDRARGFHALDHDGVGKRGAVAEHRGAQGGRQVGGSFKIFDGYGDPVEGAQGPAAGYGVIGSPGIGKGLLRPEGQVGVEPGIEGFDTLEVLLRDFNGGCSPGANGAAKFNGGGVG